MKIEELGLHDLLVDGILSMGFKEPTPIQQQAIPEVLKGKDLMGIAQTGTGKTAAFLLPVLDYILKNPADHTRALVIVPTRELAVQIDQAVEAYSYYTGISSRAIYGGGDGQDFYQEKLAMTQGTEIIIATPGRLISHMNIGNVDFSKLNFLVLDEADRMLDMGFQPDLFKIISSTNPTRQTLMFSATMPAGVMRLAEQFLRDPVKVSIAVSRPAERVKQGVYRLGHDQKLNLMNALLNSEERKDYRVIVFCSRKSAVAALYRKLRERQSSVGRISSELEQEERESVMLKFRNGEIRVLVATDVISRGIDIDGIDMVVNYDVPRDPEDYVHRIGRTARAQRSGEAITLIAADEERGFARIEKLIGSKITELELPAGVSKGNNTILATNDARKKSPHHRKSFHRKGNSGASKAQ